MWFDVIIGNPPYQTPDKNHSLWQDFIYKGMEHLKENGFMIQITPKSWTLNSKNIFELFKTYDLQYVNHNVNDYFPSIFKDIGWWVLKKNKSSSTSTEIVENDFSMCINNIREYKYLPHTFLNTTTWQLFNSIVTNTKEEQKKITFWKSFHILNDNELNLLSNNKQDYILFSKSRYSDYLKNIGWSSRFHGRHNVPYSSQVIGLNISHYSEQQQKIIIEMFSSSFYSHWHDLLGGKNSNNILRIMNYLPKLPITNALYSQEKEQLVHKIKHKKVTPVKTSVIKNKDRINKTGEIFTPNELIEQLLNKIPKHLLKNPESKFLDMSCGNGQFLIAILDKLKQYHDETHILSHMIYGVDIMLDNIRECRSRLNLSLTDVSGNIVTANALKYDFSFIKDVTQFKKYYINYEDGIFF